MSTPIEPDSSSTQVFGFLDFGSFLESIAPGLSAQDAAAVAALPPGTALLLVQQGPTTGARFLLDSAETTVGRHPRADIFLDDVTVSRRHASFSFNAGAFEITDAGSLNGTYVNGDRVDHVSLQDGDEVRIGKFVFVFCAGRSR